MSREQNRIKVWVEAMRLRTLPVSTAGVITAVALTGIYGCFKVLPSLLCLLFAILAQISSNFANEYFDYRDGLDKPGREGPRRGVTEGDITPGAMLRATIVSLAAACAIGCTLIIWGGWELVPVGLAITAGVFAYSAGPYPLSHHALGEVGVVIFFGIVPVNMTYYIMGHQFGIAIFMVSLAVGLMGANILLVNNYRDIDDDRAVGKHTLATVFGARVATTLYLLNGWIAVALASPLLIELPWAIWIAPALYLGCHTTLWCSLLRLKGRELNRLLGMTAFNMLAFSLIFALIVFAY
ncbi:MAG: 1,4-dihydroxy-2-naphthoate octaprenyltransferase [Muribaculaceae bacterium]|nr:1,4-dihydroxy-2-naphthoate octaprenyltransferase [Muribaculaceae bacterium]